MLSPDWKTTSELFLRRKALHSCRGSQEQRFYDPPTDGEVVVERISCLRATRVILCRTMVDGKIVFTPKFELSTKPATAFIRVDGNDVIIGPEVDGAEFRKLTVTSGMISKVRCLEARGLSLERQGEQLYYCFV